MTNVLTLERGDSLAKYTNYVLYTQGEARESN